MINYFEVATIFKLHKYHQAIKTCLSSYEDAEQHQDNRIISHLLVGY